MLGAPLHLGRGARASRKEGGPASSCPRSCSPRLSHPCSCTVPALCGSGACPARWVYPKVMAMATMIIITIISSRRPVLEDTVECAEEVHEVVHVVQVPAVGRSWRRKGGISEPTKTLVRAELPARGPLLSADPGARPRGWACRVGVQFDGAREASSAWTPMHTPWRAQRR